MRTPSTKRLVRRHTALLLETVDRLDDIALRAPSLCPGWMRGHVVTHLARNADALSRVVHALVDDADVTMYPSDEERDREIADGATRPVTEQADDVRATAARFEDDVERLRPEHEERDVARTPGAERRIPGGVIDVLRLNEIVLHHIDLDSGFGFADIDDETVGVLLEVAVVTTDPVPGLTLRATEGDEYTIGDGAVHVHGSRRGILAYLTRQHTDAVTVNEGTRE